MREGLDILEPPAIPERVLVERFQQGDRDAFTTLYRVHHPAVFRFVLLMTADSEKAAEITQETFVWMIRHPNSFDPARGSLGPFLGGVARKMLQRLQRGERRWLPFRELGGWASANSVSHTDRAIDGAAVRKAIAALPFHYREAVVLCDLDSKSYEEAAAIAGCAVGTIRSRLHRGRELLARRFQPRQEARK